MDKLIITIERNTEIARKILKGWQYVMYNITVGSLLKIIHKSCSKFKTKEEKNKTIYEEIGETKYIELQKRKFENFMFADYGELNTDKYSQYKRNINDRWIQKVARGAHKLKDIIKDKAIRSSLGGTDVLSFFSKIGIFITWEVKKENGKKK